MLMAQADGDSASWPGPVVGSQSGLETSGTAAVKFAARGGTALVSSTFALLSPRVVLAFPTTNTPLFVTSRASPASKT